LILKQYPDIREINHDYIKNIPMDELHDLEHLNRRNARDLEKNFTSHIGIAHQDLVTETFFND
jgi:hypothetical protein